MDLHLEGKAFVVTGGSSGLGFATAQCLVDEGASVVIVGRSPSRIETALEKLGGSGSAVEGDLSNPETIIKAIELAKNEHGRLDGAFISHGGPPVGRADSFNDDELKSSFVAAAINPIRAAREVANELSTGGSLLVLTSSTAKEITVGMTGSNVARPAVEAYIKELSFVVGPHGVRVNVLVPGIYDTERLAVLDKARGWAAAEREGPKVPLRRIGKPMELGRVACFLLSDASSYISGASITVDGGRRKTM